MNTPVTHGSGVMIVTATGKDTQVGTISGLLNDDQEGDDPAHAPAHAHDAVDRRGGARHDGRDVRPGPVARPGAQGPLRDGRGPRHRGHPRGPAHGGAGDPLARGRGSGQAQRHRQGPGLGGDAGLHLGHQLGQDRHPHHEPDDRGRGTGRRRQVHRHRHRLLAGRPDQPRRRPDAQHRRHHPAVHRGQRRQAGGRQGRGRPHRGRAARAGRQGQDRSGRHPRAVPAPRHAAVRPHRQAHGGVRGRHRRVRQEVGALLRQGRGAGRAGQVHHGPRRRRARAVRRRQAQARRRRGRAHGGRGPARHGGRPLLHRAGRVRPQGRPARATSRTSRSRAWWA